MKDKEKLDNKNERVPNFIKRGKIKKMLRHKKARTPGQRHQVRIKVETEGGRKKIPGERRVVKKKTGGRNQTGRITVHQRGGGIKRRRRRRVNGGKERGIGKVRGIQYDPNRTGRIARRGVGKEKREGRNRGSKTEYSEYKYVLAVKDLKVGDWIQYGDGEEGVNEVNEVNGVNGVKKKREESQRRGSTKKLKEIEVGGRICNREMVEGRGAQVARAAGQSGRIRRKEREEGVVLVRLKGGKTVSVSTECTATYGIVSGEDNGITKRGKAGRRRNRGWRPKVRGEAMNPVDHPHGGRTRGGRPERTPWGRLAKGKPTVSSSKKKGSSWKRKEE